MRCSYILHGITAISSLQGYRFYRLFNEIKHFFLSLRAKSVHQGVILIISTNQIQTQSVTFPLLVFIKTTIQMMMIINITKIGVACGLVEWFALWNCDLRRVLLLNDIGHSANLILNSSLSSLSWHHHCICCCFSQLGPLK